jgi:integrase
LIFTISNGTPIHYQNLLRDFHNVLKCVGLPIIHFHGLLHACASLLLSQVVPVIVVPRRSGHLRASITLDVYAQLTPSKKSEVAELIDELVMPIAVQIDQKVS